MPRPSPTQHRKLIRNLKLKSTKKPKATAHPKKWKSLNHRSQHQTLKRIRLVKSSHKRKKKNSQSLKRRKKNSQKRRKKNSQKRRKTNSQKRKKKNSQRPNNKRRLKRRSQN